MKTTFLEIAKSQGDGAEAAIRAEMVKALADHDGGALFDAAAAEFEGEELAEVCGEIVETITAECSADDFHNWNYDHLEFIIDLSNSRGFEIPRNLLNGLPEQLIILVDAKKLGEPGCD